MTTSEQGENRAALIASAPDLYAALKAVEQSGYNRLSGGPTCPSCESMEIGTHWPDCQLAAALRKAEGVQS